MKAYAFRLPLKRPLPLGERTHDFRRGVLVEHDGAWAEASPLPGFSSESIDDVVAAITGTSGSVPSWAFASDSLRRPWTECRVVVNPLLQGTTEEVIRKCQRVARSAAEVVKLKLGRGDITADIELVQEVCRILGSDCQLRLDVNRAWHLDEAVFFARAIGGCPVQYIEEPLKDPQLLEDLYRETKVPYALDETVAEGVPLTGFPNASAIICKPTLLGDRLAELIASQYPLVFSAAYESGLGIARIAQLAAEFAPGTPVGLDTYDWLEGDVLQTGVTFNEGELHVAAAFSLNWDVLEPLRV